MAKKGKLWTITRPTRDLHDLELALKAFSKLAKGKKWRGNRLLQRKFETENPAKTKHAGIYGSGGRTWAALLRVYGLWYEDDDSVKLTSAGEVLVSGKNVYQQIVRLIMNFQITSAYSEHQKLEDGFRIFPFRFMLRLLLDKRIKYLEEDEVALFLLNVKTPEEYENVVKTILNYRRKRNTNGLELKQRTELIKNHMKKYRPDKRTDSPRDVEGHWKYIKDIANTILNHIRFLHEIEYDKNKGIIRIKESDKKKVKQMLEEYEVVFPFSTLYKYSEKAFQKHYGLRYDRRKATKKVTAPKTRDAKRLAKIQTAFAEILKTGSGMSHDKLIEKIKDMTGISSKDIVKIVTDNPELISLETAGLDQSFVDYYLEVGNSGKDDITFEKMTREIFTDIGFPTKKHKIKKRIGAGKPEIDGLMKNPKTSRSGLLECKSGAKYSLSVGDREKMKNVYIPNFISFKCDGKTYKLDFFVYVVGNKFGGFENFKDIIHDTKLKGSIIYARDLLNLYSKYKSREVTREKIWSIFKQNKHITWKDVEDIAKK